jgi:hypothetical protein
MIHSVLSHVWHFLACITPGEWAVFFAEIAVAWVIFLEIEHNRDSAFLTTVTNEKSDCERRWIYAAYLDQTGTIEERTDKFQKALHSSDGGNRLRRCCHNQLAMFNNMGFEANRWALIDWLAFKKDRYVSVFPHAPIFFWLIVGPHELERRKLTGPWFGQHALIFIEHSIQYVLRYTNELKLSLGDEAKAVTLTRDDMEKMREELKKLVAEKVPLKNR